MSEVCEKENLKRKISTGSDDSDLDQEEKKKLWSFWNGKENEEDGRNWMSIADKVATIGKGKKTSSTGERTKDGFDMEEEEFVSVCVCHSSDEDGEFCAYRTVNICSLFKLTVTLY